MSAEAVLVWLAELGWKSTALLGVALIVAAALRRSSAATRHSLLAAAVSATLALPAVSLLAPIVHVTLPTSSDAPQVVARDEPRAKMSASAGDAPHSAYSGTPSDAARPMGNEERAVSRLFVSISWPALAILAYLVGAAAVLAYFGFGLIRGGQLVRGLGAASASAQAFVDSVAAELGLRRLPSARLAPRACTPWVFGVLRPVIALPSAFDAWTEDERRSAVVHELAHVQRLDQLTLAAAWLAAAALWFQPLAWLALRQLRREAERACDDRVLLQGASATGYAAQLVEIARAIHSSDERHLPVIAMARPSAVAVRVRAILNPTIRRTAMNKPRILLASLVSVALLGAIGPLMPTAAQVDSDGSGGLANPAFQALAANGPTNEAELAQLVTTYADNDRQAEAVQALVEFLSRDDVATCHFCSDLLRHRRAFWEPSLAPLASPTWAALHPVLRSAFEQLEQHAYATNDTGLLLKLAGIHAESGESAGGAGKGAWYLLESLRLGGGTATAREKLLTLRVLHDMGRFADAAAIARELHDDPSSDTYQSEETRRWLDYFETTVQRNNELSVRLRAFGRTPSEELEYLPLYKEAPRYPTNAAMQGLEGDVIVEFTVDASGKTRDVYVVRSSNGVFEEAALEAAKSFRYMPRMVGGTPVDVPGVRNKITFVLERGG